MIGFAIFLFVLALFICVCAISFLVMTIQALIEKCHYRYQQYHLQKPIKHNSSSRYAMNNWWLSKRDLRKLKMVMSEVSIQENQQFNV
jgi:hypothetical protein